MSFVNSTHTVITGESILNHVEGNQFNGQVINFNGQAVAKRTKYDEFDYVKSGHIIALKTLHTDWDWDWKLRKLIKGRKTISTIELHSDQKSRYTAMMYEGEDAERLWEEDFRQFSCTRKPDSFQLFGINQSIPALIFRYELIPYAHFYTGSFWMNVYIRHLAGNMGCWDRMVWMNTTSGMLFRGPEGPHTIFSCLVDESIVVPSTVDMLKDDISLRFFSKFGSKADNSVLDCALHSYRHTYLNNLFLWMAEDYRSKDADHPDSSSVMSRCLCDLWRNPPNHLPMDVLGGLRFDTVYSPSLEAVARRPQGARSVWEWRWMKGLEDETELDGELTRLDPGQREYVNLRVHTDRWTFGREWLLQCLHVFDALGVTEGKEKFFTVGPPILVSRPATSPSRHNAEHLIEETPPTPIYLFLHHPLPMTISELVSWKEGTPYFWSFDEIGQSRMSEEECERWRLPALTIRTGPQLRSWQTHVYTALRDWQKARGFDPTTSDWARSMGHPELEIIDTEDCFAVVEETLDEEWEVLDAFGCMVR